MPRAKKETPNLKLADFTAQRGERADAMMPGDTPIRNEPVLR